MLRCGGCGSRPNERVEAGQASLDEFEGGVLPGEAPPDEIMEMLTLARNRINLVYNSEEYFDASTRQRPSSRRPLPPFPAHPTNHDNLT